MKPICQRWIDERLSYDKLSAISEPKRVLRSKTVRGPPLDLEAYKDSLYFIYNFKSFPSTTNRRHKGYIKFLKPKRQMPLEKVDCQVDCSCPDYRYRYAHANKQHGSGNVGSNSLNQAINRAPRITNPKGRPGLCKHLLALRDFIYGEQEEFTSDRPDASKKLNRLVQNIQRGLVVPSKASPEDDKDRPDDKAPGKAPELDVPAVDQVPEAPPKVVKPSRSTSPVSKPSRSVAPMVKPTAKPVQSKDGRAEGVVNHVNTPIQSILEEVDKIEVDGSEDGGQSEALNILREIRDLLKNLAAEEAAEQAPPPEKKEEEQDLEVPALPAAEDERADDKESA